MPGESDTAMYQELRDMVEDWRDMSDLYIESDVESEVDMALQQYECAEKLEEVLDKYEGETHR